MQDDFDYYHIAHNGTLEEQLRNESFFRQLDEFRKQANKKRLAYIWLVLIPAWILGVTINIILFPIYVLWMVFSATWFWIHHINRPEELFRNMRNAEF